ncbi:acylneuraminate cytidylyltransferase [Salinibacterium sp. SYSU T00001]|uniref:acylneuraminate cytidylyltransferase n=1 Tax=Homoserinimonas sedimenticola TaxID=2986805 RepID=UPI002235BC3F|nr:acylneuraminate cytidylyltransferase [Salinibacterium sedimenticola]MCW4384975.1 acylneuraminate cytidylyltransferase [Salinibacterium sedimenticola]
MSVIAVVPARGGSKGIPGKNLRKVGGVPLVARAVLAARAAQRIDRVIVTTDDDEIDRVASAAGAEVIDRPAEIAGDTASSESALLHVIESLGEVPDVLVMVQATSPFIDPGDLDAAVAEVMSGYRDCVFSGVETHEFLWRIRGGGAEGVNHDALVRLPRQQREPEYRESGAFYAMRGSGFIEARHRFFGRIGIVPVDARGALEIDTVEELDLACAIAPVWESHPSLPIDVDAVVTDFDGVHTDDRVVISADGVERVTVTRTDGMGVDLLRRAGVPVLILSTERNAVVSARARKLDVDVVQGARDKVVALWEWISARGLDPERVAYLGNDVNDLGCLASVGWPVAVADSHPDVLAAARLVLTSRGGHGAVRELADLVLLAAERREASMHGVSRPAASDHLQETP